MKRQFKPYVVAAALAALTMTAAPAGELAEQLGGKLVQVKDGEVVAAPADALEGKKHIAVYYSAHWCPPCRKFTPELSKFYDEVKESHPDFELVFVSSDKDEDAMKEYMNWGKMNYLAVDYDEVKTSGLKEHAASGIPYLILLDAEGNEVVAKAEGERWRSPVEVLEEIKGLLAKG